MSSMKPTPEQEQAIQIASSGSSFKIAAYAGTGKTSTAKLIGQCLSHKKGLYLAFNKAIAKEAQSKFKSNITCRTFHALAYGASPSYLIDKLQLPRNMPKDIADMFNLYSTSLALEKDPNKFAPCTTWDLGLIIERSINNFCCTDEKEVIIDNIMASMPKWADPNSCLVLANELLEPVQNYWNMSVDRHSPIKISHSVYLKHWSLNNPEINADFVLFDEAQDADPIMLNLLGKQGIQVIYIGDRHQSIYGWRGAVNAMQSIKVPEVRLTKSFRFGQEIADCANLILNNLLDEPVPLIGNENLKSTVSVVDEPDAFLVRTNAGAFEVAFLLAREGRKPRVEVDVDALNRQLDDAEKLQCNVKVDKNSDYYGFSNWQEVINYAEVNVGSDISAFAKLIEANGVDVLRDVVEKLSQVEGDCVVSTAHKSKGLEFNSVMLFGDFTWNQQDSNEPLMTPDESRLIYVAATRAMKNLDVGGMGGFFNKLNKLNGTRNQVEE